MADQQMTHLKIEDEMWDAFYAVHVLVERIDEHFSDAVQGQQYHISEHAALVTQFSANQARSKVERLVDRFRQVHEDQKGSAS